jgi:hypothetical protein
VRRGAEGSRAKLHWLLALAIVLLGALAVPAGGAAASKWTEQQLPPQPVDGGNSTERPFLYGVSCPSESLCVAVGAFDTIAFSQTPTQAADRWHVVNPTYDEPNQACLERGESIEFCSSPRGAIDAISCAGVSLCVAAGYEGNVFTSTDPTGGASAWSVTNVNAPGSARHLTAVSCPSASLCVAVSGAPGGAPGTVVSSTDPAAGLWTAAQLPGAPDLRGVSCPTPALCVAVAKEGRIFVSTDPAGDASSWRQVPSPTARDLQGISCVASPLCVAGDAGGNVLSSTEPLGRPPFTLANADGSVQVTGLSCPTTDRCVAVDNNADVLTSTDPTGGPSSWTFENLVPFEAEALDHGQFVGNALWGASCASPSLCLLVGTESRIFSATEPFAAPNPSPAVGRATHRKRLRPRTRLVFAEGFWMSSITRHRHIKARFHFYSRDGARAFLCKPDHRRWRRCHSPLRYWVPIGHHVLRVRAVGPTGLRGPIATARFEVTRQRRPVSAQPGA